MKQKTKQRNCHFCINQFKEINHLDTSLLRRSLSSFTRIVPRKRSGVCAWHQRKLARAIKRARTMGLLPFVLK